MAGVQPDFEILRHEFKHETQNLDEVPSDDLRQSLTALILTISERGYGKRTPLAEYRVISRGGKGVISLKTTERNGPVVSAVQVGEESDVMVITEQGKIIRVHSSEIREAGRSTQGVRLLKLEENDRIADAAVLLESDEEVSGSAPADTQPRTVN
jgi:DNA gyrase subunit A